MPNFWRDIEGGAMAMLKKVMPWKLRLVLPTLQLAIALMLIGDLTLQCWRGQQQQRVQLYHHITDCVPLGPGGLYFLIGRNANLDLRVTDKERSIAIINLPATLVDIGVIYSADRIAGPHASAWPSFGAYEPPLSGLSEETLFLSLVGLQWYAFAALLIARFPARAAKIASVIFMSCFALATLGLVADLPLVGPWFRLLWIAAVPVLAVSWIIAPFVILIGFPRKRYVGL